MTHVTTNNSSLQYGSFYIGLTKDEYSKTNNDIKLFTNIDSLDGNITGKLSETDMLRYRMDEAKKSGTMSLLTGAAAVASAFAGGPIGWTIFGVNAIISAWAAHDMININTENEKFIY